MKRFLSIVAVILLICLSSQAAFASSAAMYPVDITRSEDGLEIRKVYVLGIDDDPETIPKKEFEQFGFRYTLTDIIRVETPHTASRPHTEIVTVESSKNDTETVLSLLDDCIEYTAEDGFSGILNLDVSSIKIEATGYGTSSRQITATRSYPNLASADTQHIPKEISENGKTLTLSGVDWRSDNTYNADDYAITDRYTAVATYAGTSTSSYVKGYEITATYSGELSQTKLSQVKYTAIFYGTPLEEPEPEEPEHSGLGLWLYVLIALAILAVVSGAYFLIRRRREADQYDDEDNADDVDAVAD